MRTTIITVIVQADEPEKDQEIVDLTVRLGHALERRGRLALLTVHTRWETKAGAPDGLADALVAEALRKAVAKPAEPTPPPAEKPEGSS